MKLISLLLISFFLVSCQTLSRGIPLNIQMRSIITEEKETLTKEGLIINSFAKQEQRLIIQAFQIIGADVFEVARELKEYGKADLKGFCQYLLVSQYPFTDPKVSEERKSNTLNSYFESESFKDIRNSYNLLKNIADVKNKEAK